MNKPVEETLGVHALTEREFELFRRLAYDHCGIDLKGKHTLVATRLNKKLRQLKLNSFQDYYEHLVADQTRESLTGLIDALTTNHTSFFREVAHFDFLRTAILPALRKRDRISIWSAACSTGEEPYTIAFCLLEELGEEEFGKVKILATDISTRVLASAQEGIYPAESFKDIPTHQLRRYVLRGNGRFLVKPALRAAVEFRRQNLMENLSHLGPFQVIFCRNVMIYFDKPTQQDLVNRLSGCLEPGGYLMIGHAESLNGLNQPLRFIQSAVYQKPGGVAAGFKGGKSRP